MHEVEGAWGKAGGSLRAALRTRSPAQRVPGGRELGVHMPGGAAARGPCHHPAVRWAARACGGCSAAWGQQVLGCS